MNNVFSIPVYIFKLTSEVFTVSFYFHPLLSVVNSFGAFLLLIEI